MAFNAYPNRMNEKRSEPQLQENDRVLVEKKHICSSCFAHITESELEENHFVCPECHHHFRIDVVERLRITIDNESFEEFGGSVESRNIIGFPGYESKLEKAKEKSKMNSGVVTGTCSILGRDAVIAVMSFKFMGGSMGSAVGEKITRAIEEGISRELPVIIFTASGGARMQEGIFSLMQMAKTSAALALASEAGIPIFVVLADPTTGGVVASYAMLGDVNLAEPDALIGFAGARVAKGTIGEKFPEGFQRAEFQLKCGFIDAIVERKDMRQTLAFLIDTHTRS